MDSCVYTNSSFYQKIIKGDLHLFDRKMNIFIDS